ncbi:hypothetical protein GJAV_G00194020 [Gymnothorax javanicus]|nr:hypothetical protein GJAV_G00194020 [Gymnothorax javanicus]
MASTQTLRQHNQNQARPEEIRNAKRHVHGATALGTKHFASKQETENQDPSSRNAAKATAVGRHVGTSRLPVLARSQHLQPQTGLTYGLQKREQDLQKGRALKKKPCTKPVPFNLSKPRASRAATSSQSASQSAAAVATKSICPNASKQLQPPGSTASTNKQLAVTTTHTMHSVTAPRASLPVTAPRASLPVTAPHASLPVTAPHASLSHNRVPSAAALAGHICPAGSQSADSQQTVNNAAFQSGPRSVLKNVPNRDACVRPAGRVHHVKFSPDPAALDSILKNEGVKAKGLLGATPKSSVCPAGRETSLYMPQRVSVLRTRPRPPGPPGAGAAHFSPDPAALGSILRNEGVEVEGPPGATPRGSLCPTGRGTSVYMPQRIPVSKAPSETAGAAAGLGPGQTPAVKGTPQRVPNTRPQSAMRRLATNRTPILRGSPVLRRLSEVERELGSHKEPVVQKLFEEADPTVESNADLREGRVTDGLKDQPVSLQPGGEEDSGSGGSVTDRRGHVQPFIPPPQRESVIVFSSAKKLITAASLQQSCPAPSDSDRIPLLHPLSTPRSAVPANHSVSSETLPAPLPCLSTAKGGVIQRVPQLCSGGPGVRRRPPPLEECLLDEECASLTSRPSASISTAHLRCGDPVSSVLLLQTSSCFVPIDLPPPSTMQECQLICCPLPISARENNLDL